MRLIEVRKWKSALHTSTERVGAFALSDLNDRLQMTNGKHRDLGATLDKGYNKFAEKFIVLEFQ